MGAFSEGAAVDLRDAGIVDGAGVDSSVLGAMELDAALETSADGVGGRLELSELAAV